MQILTIIKKEFLGHFNNPIGAIFIFAFVAISIFLCVDIGQFIEFNEASLYSMFQFMPWLMAFFIPSLSMRIWAEENKTNTIETLLSLPIKSYELILGKYIACLLIIAIALILTFPFWIFVNFLGNADNSVIIGGYFATIILGAAFLALSFAVSINIKTPAIAFILASALCVFINSIGIPFINENFEKLISIFVIGNKTDANTLIDHYDNLIRGNYTFAAIFFFFTLILSGLEIANINYKSLKTKYLKLKKSKLIIITIIIATLFLQTFGAFLLSGKGVDLTQDKLFTLSNDTKNFIKKAENKIEINYYFSKNAASQNPDLRNFGQNIRDKLRQYSNISHDKVMLNELNISQFSTIEDEAIKKGLVPYNDIAANLEPIYIGIVLKIKDKEFIFRRLSPNEFDQFEFSLNKAILALQKNRRETIAILSAQDWFVKKNEFGEVEPLTQISKNLFQDYSIINLEPDFKSLPINLDILLIAQPWDLSDDEQYIIDQFVVSGGKVILALDTFSSISNDNQIGKIQYTQSLGRLENNWGVVFSNQIILDKKNSLSVYSQINGQQTAIKQPAFLKLFSNSPAYDINFATVSSFLKPNNNLNFVPIITSSNQTMILSPQEYSKDESPQTILENWVDNGNEHIIAAQLSGKINSSFEAARPNLSKINFTKQSKKEAKIIAIADTDFLSNSLYINGQIKDANNANFIINIIEQLLENQNTDILKQKNKQTRNLEFIDNLKAKAQNNIIENENSLARKIEEIEIELSDLKLQDVESSKAKQAQLKAQMLDAQKNLRATQEGIRRSTETIKLIIIMFCGIFVPLLFMIFTLMNFYWRNKGAKIEQNS